MVQVTDVPEFTEGMDQSAWIFMNNSDVPKFLNMLFQGIDSSDADESVELPKNYIMTIDLLDLSLRSFFVAEKDKLTVRTYGRDDSTSDFFVYDEATGSVPLTEDGAIKLSNVAEMLQKNHYLVFLLSYFAVRKIMEKDGIAQELFKMNDKTAGAMVSLENGEPKIRIVKGLERPALLTSVSFMGEVEVRPYPDEL